MLIANKNKTQIINMDETASIFANNEKRIVVMMANGRNVVVDDYPTREAALKSMEILIERIRIATDKTTIVFTPTDEEVGKVLNGSREHYRHIDGRKSKGHGGS